MPVFGVYLFAFIIKYVSLWDNQTRPFLLYNISLSTFI